MNKKNTIILILLIVAFAAAGLAYTQFSKPEPAPVQLTNTNQGDEVDTSGWKTYRNEEYGFELKYPGSNEFTVNMIKGQFLDPNYFSLFTLKSSVGYEIDISLDTYPASSIEAIRKNIEAGKDQEWSRVNEIITEEFTTDRSDNIYYKTSDKYGNNFIHNIFISDGNAYDFYYETQDFNTINKEHKIFELITKIFKFL